LQTPDEQPGAGPALQTCPHAPQLLTSDCGLVHAPEQHSPDVHVTPFATSLQSEVVVDGWQLWQGLLGFASPGV
jgi:hypothetical protein